MLQTTFYVICLTLMLLGECKGNTTIGDLDYMFNLLYMYPPSLSRSARIITLIIVKLIKHTPDAC